MSETIAETSTGEEPAAPVGDAPDLPGVGVEEDAGPTGSAAPETASSWAPSQQEWAQMQQAQQAAMGVAGQLAPLAEAFQTQQTASYEDQLVAALQEARDIGDVGLELQIQRQISQAQFEQFRQSELEQQQQQRATEFAFNQEFQRATQDPNIAAIDGMVGHEGASRELLLHLASGYEFAGQPMGQAVQTAGRVIASIVDKAKAQAVEDYKKSLSSPGTTEPAAGAAAISGGDGKPRGFDDVIASWQNRDRL